MFKGDERKIQLVFEIIGAIISLVPNLKKIFCFGGITGGGKRFRDELSRQLAAIDKQIGRDTLNALFTEFELSYDLWGYLETPSSGQSVINGNKVNVRAKPNTRAKVVIQLNTGEPVTVLETSGSGSNMWYKIKTSGGRTGWVFGEYVKQN